MSIPDASNFEATITNANPLSSLQTTATITLLINCDTYTAYASTVRLNGTVRVMQFCGGESSIDLTGCTSVIQTISVIYSGSATVPVLILSSVVPCMI